MKSLRVLAGLMLVLGVAGRGVAHEHSADHAVARFVSAWNSHDTVEMAKRWTADARAVDMQGREASGRGAVARLFTSGTSTIRLASALSVQKHAAGQTVEFDAEITGLRDARGATVAPFVRHFKAVLVWGPDLPGGHHPKGRYYIASLR